MDKIDHNKFANTVLYLVRGCGDRAPGMTKLIKMLCHADFLHYRRHLRPITNLTYVALERGPAPDGYSELFDTLVHGGVVHRREVNIQDQEKPKIEFYADKDANERVFDDSELEVLEETIALCREKSGRDLSDASHLGPWSWIWDADNPGRKIPYALTRWADNTCDDEDLARAAESLKRPEVQARLEKLGKIS